MGGTARNFSSGAVGYRRRRRLIRLDRSTLLLLVGPMGIAVINACCFGYPRGHFSTSLGMSDGSAVGRTRCVMHAFLLSDSDGCFYKMAESLGFGGFLSRVCSAGASGVLWLIVSGLGKHITGANLALLLIGMISGMFGGSAAGETRCVMHAKLLPSFYWSAIFAGFLLVVCQAKFILSGGIDRLCSTIWMENAHLASPCMSGGAAAGITRSIMDAFLMLGWRFAAFAQGVVQEFVHLPKDAWTPARPVLISGFIYIIAGTDVVFTENVYLVTHSLLSELFSV